MKKLLIFFFLLFLSIFSQSQAQGQAHGLNVPPCGITPFYICDDDGVAVINLVEAFPFRSLFCYDNGEKEEDYFPIDFYETSDDMLNENNKITNPTTYTNISSHQNIYYRANAIDSEATVKYISMSDNF